MKYDKLIRDKIPEKIEKVGDWCKIHVANDDEYWNKLKAKIGEEVGEFLDNPCVEELADVLEVVYAISDFKFAGKDKLERVRKKKFEERGGFGKRFILDESEDR